MKRTRYRYINLTDELYRESHCYGWLPTVYHSKEEAFKYKLPKENVYRLVKVKGV